MNVTPMELMWAEAALWPGTAPVRQNGVLPVLLAFP